MTWYAFLLWAHIVCAVVWVGGGLALQVLARLVLRENDGPRLAGFTRDAAWVGMHVFMPASLLLIVSAVLLMIEGDLDWGSLWINAALVIWALSAVAGAAFFGPESARIGALVAGRGPDAPEVRARVRRLLALSRTELTGLFLAVYLMAIKPGWDDTGAILVAAAIAVVPLMAVWWDYQSGSERRTAGAS